MTRIRITNDFYIDEFIHPVIYKSFGEGSTVYLSPILPPLVQLIRDKFNEEREAKGLEPVGIYPNNWGSGGKLKNSGLRDFLNPFGAGAKRSRHYYGLCADLHLTGGVSEKELYDHIIRNLDFYYEYGLTTIEDYSYTNGWVHISVEWRPNEDKVRIIKP